MQTAGTEASAALAASTSKESRTWFVRLRTFLLLRMARFLVYLFSSRKCLAWARNGLALGYAGPLTDLEVTVYSLGGRPPVPAVISLARFFRRWGKWRFYQRPDRWVLDAANRFELGRDPLLWKALVREARSPTAVEALVYWMRLRESDRWLSRLSGDALSVRRQKWEYHQRAVARGLRQPLAFQFPALIDQVEGQLRKLAQVEDLTDERYLRPQRWMLSALEKRVRTKGLLSSGPEPWKALAREQIRWEFWTLLGEVRLKRNFAEALARISALGELFGENDPMRDEAIKWVEYLETIRT
jgi:hypothetical protein